MEGIRLRTIETTENLAQVLREIEYDRGCRVLILGFANEEAFSAETAFDEDLINQIEDCSITIISVIKHFAGGLLFEILLAAHLCVISDSVRIEISNKEKLKKQVGSTLIEICKTIDDQIDAQTAFDLGLVNRVKTAEKVEIEAEEMAERISQLAPLAIKSCLRAVNRGLEMDLEDGLKLETKLFKNIFSTTDMKEGTRAFFEKRQPDFCGK